MMGRLDHGHQDSIHHTICRVCPIVWQKSSLTLDSPQDIGRRRVVCDGFGILFAVGARQTEAVETKMGAAEQWDEYPPLSMSQTE